MVPQIKLANYTSKYNINIKKGKSFGSIFQLFCPISLLTLSAEILKSCLNFLSHSISLQMLCEAFSPPLPTGVFIGRSMVSSLFLLYLTLISFDTVITLSFLTYYLLRLWSYHVLLLPSNRIGHPYVSSAVESPVSNLLVSEPLMPLLSSSLHLFSPLLFSPSLPCSSLSSFPPLT